MSMFTTRGFILAMALGVAAFTVPSVQAKDKSEDELIAEMAGPNEDKVAHAMLEYEKKYPTSTKAFPTMKKMLTDPRAKVRRKAARVLGVLHAEVSSEDIKAICKMMKSAEPREVMDGLISLRGLKAQEAMPEILPLLNHPHALVVGDACRTTAVLGTKENIPALEALLKSPEKKIQKEAQDAIFKLKAKG